MTRLLLTVGASMGLMLGAAATARAVEPYLDFVAGLREQAYFDYALLYLDSLQQRQGVPDEIRQAIPFEKAVTLQQSAQAARSAELKEERLNQAEALLEQFVRQSPNHPKAAEANTQRARILRSRAEVAIWQADSPQNAGKKQEFQTQARQLIRKARGIFQQAHDQYEKRWKQFPTFIEQNQQPELYQQRRQAEVAYIWAQIDLALCTYHEARTYDRDNPEYSKLLTQAALEFNEIHVRYRRQLIGHVAHMWEGKCYQDQDDIRKALGIYDDLLTERESAPAVRTQRRRDTTVKGLKDQVLQFRLMCLNHDKRQDYQIAIQEASAWLDAAGPRGRQTERALGIRWERARAYQKLAEKKITERIAQLDEELSEKRNAIRQNKSLSDRQKQREIQKLEQSFAQQRSELERQRKEALQAALEDAEAISKYAGQYRDVSMFLARALRVQLGENPQDPKSFDEALGLAESMRSEIKTYDNRLDDPANKDQRAEIEQEQRNHLTEMARVLNLAIDMAGSETEKKQVDRARYLLAYVYYRLRRNYEAAILAEFVARHADEETSILGLDAAYLAMFTWVQAYNDAQGGDKQFELNQMARACNLITAGWPNSDKANDARLQLGRIYRQLNRPAEAAQWFGQVPETAPHYTEAQISAGQAYWAAYLEWAPLPDDAPGRPANQDLQQWKQAARKHLQVGIAKAQKQIPEGKTDVGIFDDYIAAKVSLAQIQITDGQYQAAIDALTAPPHPVMQAIVVEQGQPRPEEGITSQEFAALSHQLLLRAYVGTQQTDKAMQTMRELEQLAPDPEQVMGVYRQLGQELQKEIERLSQLGQTERLAEVQASFQQFLGELYARKESMTAGQLIWIAETYYGLGKGMVEDDKAVAASYFDKAADSYQDIINSSHTKGAGWLDPQRLTGVKLRLVDCRRQQGQFQQAWQLVLEVLKEKPRALDAQIEAASVLEDWAASGQNGAAERYLQAIQGVEKEGVDVWGWGRMALLLQRRVDAGLATPEQTDAMFETRYRSARCRHRYGMALGSASERQAAFEMAKQEIDLFAAIIGSEAPEKWKRTYNQLYRDVLASMRDEGMTLAGGEPVVVHDLVWPKAVQPTAAQPVAQTEQAAADETEDAAVKAPPPEEPNWLYLALALLAGAGAVYGVYYVMSKQGTPRPYAYYADDVPRILASSAPTTKQSRKRTTRTPQRKGTVRKTGTRPARPKSKNEP